MALTKVIGSGVEGITNLSNATFLSVNASEVATLLTSAVINSEGGAVTTNIAQGLVKAWVNFNGTGTPAIQDSLNVSSLTDHGTGDYTVVIGNNMGNASYSYLATASNWETGNSADSYIGVSGHHGGQATTGQRIINYRQRYDVETPTVKDPLTINLAAHGDLA